MADSKETLICPNCGKEMKKFFIKEHNFNINVCIDGCGGIWFDNREFKKFDEENESIDEILSIYNGKIFPIVNSKSKKVCPVCNAIMVESYTNIAQSVVMDTCYSCGGTFLDFGELEKARGSQDTKEKFNDEFFKQNQHIIDLTMKEPMEDWQGFESQEERIKLANRHSSKTMNFMNNIAQKVKEKIEFERQRKL